MRHAMNHQKEQPANQLFVDGKDVLASVYRMYSRDMYAYGLAVYPDAELVEDAIHDVVIEISKRIDSLALVNDPKMYLFASVRHRIGYLLKRNRLYVDLPAEAEESLIERPFEEEMIEREEETSRKRLLTRQLAKLDPHQREALHLRFVEGMKFNKIAEIMQMNPQSVQNLVQRVLNKLRKELIA